jgi:hypothetical protein
MGKIRQPMQLTLFTSSKTAERPIGTAAKKIARPKNPVKM